MSKRQHGAKWTIETMRRKDWDDLLFVDLKSASMIACGIEIEFTLENNRHTNLLKKTTNTNKAVFWEFLHKKYGRKP